MKRESTVTARRRVRPQAPGRALALPLTPAAITAARRARALLEAGPRGGLAARHRAVRARNDEEREIG